MGTLALIGIQNNPYPLRKVKYITLACDGYVSEAGLKLLSHYNSTKKAHDLIEGGNLIMLHESLEECLFAAKPNTDHWDKAKPVRDTSDGAFYLSSEAVIKYLYADGVWNIFIKGITPEPLPLYDYIKSRFAKVDYKVDVAQEELLSAKRATAE